MPTSGGVLRLGSARTDCLAIFDIDGTLTATNAVDDECYLRAVAEMLGVEPGAVDWSGTPHVSDAGIARYLWRCHRGRLPEAHEIEQLRARFIAILHDELIRAPDRFAGIDGAATIFPDLRAVGWEVALATGAWSASARIKLGAAGVPASDVPIGCADDAESREDIVRVAWKKAERARGAPFRRVVSVGDAPWDVRTASSLGLPFVGIGRNGRASRLREAGATTILPDLADRSAVLEALSSAARPSGGFP